MKKVLTRFAALISLCLLSCALSIPGLAQTATTGTVLGTVTDPSGAAIVSATVGLRNKATNIEATQTTNAAGQYTFANVTPGDYDVSVQKEGFRSSTVQALKVEVAKSYTVDVKLELGQVTESVTVSTEARVELQTTDAQVGGVIGGTTLQRLPTLQRDASELLTLQAGTTPYDTPANGGFGNNGGTVAGARSDQNSITMDGIDITDNTVGGGATAVNFIPTGVESLEEFRVGVSNSNSDFSRSSGGNITLVSKSGTNSLHGDAYWFHQSDGYNANSWDLNHTPDAATGQPFTAKAPFKDNRGGVSVGGPVIKNRTFVFGNYEVRRFPSTEQVSHIVPTASLRAGVLSFVDATGVVREYNLATSNACGPTGGMLCDPRGIGISPTIQALYNLNPTGNNPSLPGVDGNNTIGFTANAPLPVKDDYVTFRLDHNFSDKAHFFGRYIYSRALGPNPGATQIDTLNNKTSIVSGQDIRGDGAIGTLDYAFNSFTSNTIRYGWIRSRVFLPGLAPSSSATTLALPGTNTSAGFVALAPGLAQTGLIDVPIDVDTQRARTQGNFQRNKQLVDNFTRIQGKHNITAGGDIRWLPLVAQRNDKVVGSLASLVATEDADVLGTNQSIPAANRPPTCGGGITTFCLMPSDVIRWDRLYAATLGIVDNVNVLAVRDGSLTPQPFGTPLIADTTQRAYDMFVQDTWRLRSDLTVTLGLGYGWQTPPTEQHGQQTFEINDSTGQILTAQGYIQAKEQAAVAGQIFNPTIGYLPIRDSGRSSIWNTDYGDVSPRAAIAWNPSYSDGTLGKVFGASKTVVRVGFGIYYDRINNVQSVEIPQLGVGFAQTLVDALPLCNRNGTPGPGCVTTGANVTPGSESFRVGVDGTLPVPTVPAVSSPIVPGIGGETLSFAVDPNFKVGRSYSFDFTMQRELPGNMLMEVGYIGRLGRDLPNSVDFDSSPYKFLDKASGQSFAQAFQAVEKQLAAGVAPSALTAQPWFEDQLPGLNSLSVNQGGCGNPGLNQTQCLVSANEAAFQAFSVGQVFGGIDTARSALGMQTFNNHQIDFALFMRTHNDLSNYNAATVTLRKRPSHGLSFDMNYTFSKSLDQVGTVQNNAGTYATSFDPNFQYGPSLFDRTHIFNAIFNYDLPAGHGHKFSFNNTVADKIIGGWYVSGVFRAASGLPLTVVNGDLGGGFFGNALNAIPTVGIGSLNAGVHGSVCSSGGFGSAGDGPNCGAGLAGTGLNLFANPAAAAGDFSAVDIAAAGRDGTGNPLRAPGLWNLDSRIGKVTTFHERFKVEFSADFFNIFNHVNFFPPTLNLQSPATFGVISQELIPADRTQGSRWIELGLRVSF